MTHQKETIHTERAASAGRDKPSGTPLRGFWRALTGSRGSAREAGLDSAALRQRLGRRLGTALRGIFFGGLACLLGSTPLVLGTAPLGLALLCAGSAYTWFILGGLLLSAIISPVTLSPLAWVCVYTLCVLLRLAVMLFVDPPDLPGETPQPGFAGHVRYAGRCLSVSLRSAARNMGFSRPAPGSGRPADEEIGTYYEGAERLRCVPEDGSPEDVGPRDRTDVPPHSRPVWSAARSDARAASRKSTEETADAEVRLFREHPALRALVGAVTGLLAGFIGAAAGGFHVYDLLGALFLLIAVPAAVLLLSPLFSPAGLTLLFDAHPDASLTAERVGADAKTVSPGRELLLASAAASLMCLAAVFCAGQYSFMIGTPYLTVMPATLLGLLLTLSAASRLGLWPGLCVALLSGIGAGAALLPVFLLTAVVYALLHILSHRAGVVGGCCAGAVWCAACGSTLLTITQLPSILLAAPVWLLIEALWDKLPAAAAGEADGRGDFVRAESGQARLTAQRARLSALTAAFTDLSQELNKLSGDLKKPKVPELRAVCDEAFRERCARCIRRDSCAGLSDSRVERTAERLTALLEARGTAAEASLPPAYREYCPHMGELIADINARCAELTRAMIRGEKTRVLASDYAHMASILTDVLKEDTADEIELKENREAADRIFGYLTSIGLRVQGVVVCGREARRIVVRGEGMEKTGDRAEEIRRKLEEICGMRLSEPVFEEGPSFTVMTLTSRPAVMPVYAGSTVPADFAAGRESGGGDVLPPPLTGDGTYTPPPVCGDHIAVFRSDRACFYALISDGMGSGQDASETSGLCTLFLERMLSAGNHVEISLRMLNSLLLAKNEGGGSECSATVDLMELDTVGGHAVFAKNGAAPTYVVRGGVVYKLRSRSLPLGILRDSSPQLLRFRMHPGDVVVMVSDGVTLGNDECPWLIDLLSTPLPDSMDSLRLDILNRAIASGSPDDLSAIAIRVEDADGKNV